MSKMFGGEMGAAVLQKANEKLEEAIEDLRVKYERIREEEAAAAAIKAREDAAAAAKRAKMKGKAKSGGGGGGGGSGGKEEGEDDEDAHHDRDDVEAPREEAAAVREAAATAAGELLDEEEGDPEFESLRAARIAQLRKVAEKRKEERSMGHGEYREIVEEDFLKEVTASKRVVCVFFHKDFEKCKVMDKHIFKIAPRLMGTKFVRINAEKAPFFVGKLKVRVLPTAVGFIDGVAVDRIIGFGELGGAEDFPTRNLVRKFMEGEVVTEEEGNAFLDGDAVVEGDAESTAKAKEHARRALRGFI